MRILIINYEFPPIGAGSGKASFNIAKHLVEMGHVVRVITARPMQLYSTMGSLLVLAGMGSGAYLAYKEITVNIDLGGEGLTIIAVSLFLSGLILRAMGLMWGLIIPFQGLPGREFIDGVEVRRIPTLRAKQEHCSTPELFSFMVSGMIYSLRHAATFKPDIVHVFFGLPCGPIGWAIKRVYGLPYVISLRGADVPGDEVKRFKKLYPFVKPFFRFLWRDADAVVAVSNGLREIAWQTEASVPIQIIPNAIDLSLFVPRMRWGGGEEKRDGPIKLLFVGRLIKFKNLETLLEAIALLRQQAKRPFILEIVGDGTQRAQLEQQVSEQGIARNVHFTGWIERSQIVPKYQEADIFVTPSIWEGMPNTVLEAMACGLPIIATDVQGSRELVQNGKNGHLVPVMDPEALVKAMLALMEDGYERRRMGKESRRIAERTFAWEQIAGGYGGVYERVLGQGEHDDVI